MDGWVCMAWLADGSNSTYCAVQYSLLPPPLTPPGALVTVTHQPSPGSVSGGDATGLVPRRGGQLSGQLFSLPGTDGRTD